MSAYHSNDPVLLDMANREEAVVDFESCGLSQVTKVAIGTTVGIEAVGPEDVAFLDDPRGQKMFASNGGSRCDAGHAHVRRAWDANGVENVEAHGFFRLVKRTFGNVDSRTKRQVDCDGGSRSGKVPFPHVNIWSSFPKGRTSILDEHGPVGTH